MQPDKKGNVEKPCFEEVETEDSIKNNPGLKLLME